MFQIVNHDPNFIDSYYGDDEEEEPEELIWDNGQYKNGNDADEGQGTTVNEPGFNWPCPVLRSKLYKLITTQYGTEFTALQITFTVGLFLTCQE